MRAFFLVQTIARRVTRACTAGARSLESSKPYPVYGVYGSLEVPLPAKAREVPSTMGPRASWKRAAIPIVVELISYIADWMQSRQRLPIKD